MFDSELHRDDAELLARLDGVLDELVGRDLSSRADGQVLALWRELEARRCRLAPVDHAVIQQVRSRQLASACGVRSITVLARDLLRVGTGEAAARVRAAEDLGPRHSLTGEPLAPIYARVAAAQAAGSINATAARVITATIDRLPDAVKCEKDVEVETFLVAQAQVLDVDAVRQLARRLEATLDPDGLLKDAKYRTRQRDLRFTVRPDGSSHFEGEATAEFTEWARTILDVMARPRPETDGAKDSRTAGQRRHDGMLAAFKLCARANQLPHCAGITTTVVLTMTDEALATGNGTATTGHGVLLHASQAQDWIGGDARVLPVKLGPMKQVLEYGAARRLFTQTQRLAMIARDRGCSFPGCTAPPQWTEAHHVVPYREGGPTSVDSGVLLCGYDHDQHERNGWRCVMIDKIPYWIPPKWRDPEQRPIRNHAHDPQLT